MKKIVVLTSGGDSSGMNAYLKSLAQICEKNKIVLYACYYGYQGLVEGNIKKISLDELAGIENEGGSVIKVSRSKDFTTENGFNKALKTAKKFDCVIVVGGNGSFAGAKRLADAGINILAIPGTIDNDLFYTDKTLGYETACNNALDAIIKIKQTMQSCDRGAVVEVMGRNCPDITIFSAILTNADVLVTEKQPFDAILKQVEKAIKNGATSPLVVVQENLLDAKELALFLQQKTGKEFKSNVLGYLQRGGAPTSNEKLFAIELACETVKNILNSNYNKAIGIKNDIIFSQDIVSALKEKPRTSGKLKQIYDFYK